MIFSGALKYGLNPESQVVGLTSKTLWYYEVQDSARFTLENSYDDA